MPTTVTDLVELPGRNIWWQRGAIYRVYPRSFMDAGSDGVGDLRGIVSRLDHVQGLGVDLIVELA